MVLLARHLFLRTLQRQRQPNWAHQSKYHHHALTEFPEKASANSGVTDVKPVVFAAFAANAARLIAPQHAFLASYSSICKITCANKRHARRHNSTWSAAMNHASLLADASATAQQQSETGISKVKQRVNPDVPDSVLSELVAIPSRLCVLLESPNSMLHTLARYYFEPARRSGKRLRPLMVLLLAQAMSAGSNCKDLSPQSPAILQSQRRLAEIVELIHTASLLHDDVVDESDERRGVKSLNAAFGNKLAVLAGDFLLARCGSALSRLGDFRVMDLMSSVLCDMIDGEVRMAATTASSKAPLLAAAARSLVFSQSGYEKDCFTPAISGAVENTADFQNYMLRTYLKTGALLAKGARSCALLGGADGETADRVFDFGRHLGFAFQLTDDVLDLQEPEFCTTSAASSSSSSFTLRSPAGAVLHRLASRVLSAGAPKQTSAEALGKPVNQDFQLGLATAPVLYAASMYSSTLDPIIARCFSQQGDSATALRLVRESDGIARTRALASAHADLAAKALTAAIPTASPARDALLRLCHAVVDRTS